MDVTVDYRFVAAFVVVSFPGEEDAQESVNRPPEQAFGWWVGFFVKCVDLGEMCAGPLLLSIRPAVRCGAECAPERRAYREVALSVDPVMGSYVAWRLDLSPQGGGT
jgi:hypothetical protein